MDTSNARRTGTALVGLALAVGLLTGCAVEESAGPGATVDAGSGYEVPAATTDAAAPGTTGASDPAAAEAVIVISDFTFEVPDDVPPGAQVTVRNEDSVGHTVTADDGTFDVAVAPGEETTFTAPDEVGDYQFHCTPHPAMAGMLTVEG